MDIEQDNGADVVREHSHSGAGGMLRRAREDQGLSLADIATRTRIPIRQLEVIESGAFDALPSRTYAIGFARTLARALGLNEGEVTKAVRAELGDSSEQRGSMAGGMEPGDPAKLPSRGLAWAGALGALLLALGLFAWFSNYFRAGEGAPPLVAEVAEPVVEDADPADAMVPATSGEVVFTALEDGVWVRLFEEGGERFLEKTLTKGESFTVPSGARDPRLNTARPDALALTIDGKPAARLAERPVVLASEQVSATALLARVVTAPQAAATPVPVVRPRTTTARTPTAVNPAPDPAEVTTPPAPPAPVPAAPAESGD